MRCPSCKRKVPVYHTVCPLCGKSLGTRGVIDKLQVILYKASTILLLLMIPYFLIGGTIFNTPDAISAAVFATIFWLCILLGIIMWVASLVLARLPVYVKIMKFVRTFGTLAIVIGLVYIIEGGYSSVGFIVMAVGIIMVAITVKFKHKGIFLPKSEEDED